MTDLPLSTLAATTLRDPDAAAREVLSRHWTQDVLWSAMIAIACISTVLTHLAMRAQGVPPEAMLPLMRSPFVTAGLEVLLIWFTAFSLWRVGRTFGGTGDAQGALSVVVWLQALMVGFQLLQLAFLGAAALSTMLWLAGALLGFFWFVRFAMVLHGFERPWAVAGMTLLVGLSILSAVTLTLNFLGLGPNVAPPA